MRPLLLDDLLPLEEYAGRRREFFESHQRYLDRYRRVRIGPRVTLVFENRQTLWFRLQEVLRIARLGEPARVQEELNIYNRLLPGRGRLQAALLIEVADEKKLTQELAAWQTFQGLDLRLRIGETSLSSCLITCRPEDRSIGAAHWVQFPLDDKGRKLLGEFGLPARFQLHHPGYRHESLPLSEEVRQSLLDDLVLSDRDGKN
jgi:hypothetical protein